LAVGCVCFQLVAGENKVIALVIGISELLSFCDNRLDWLIRLVHFMGEIQASEAKTHLPRLLDEVERGETLIITRHGRAIARIVPEAGRQQAKIDEAMEAIRNLRRRTGRIKVDELLSARDEGRRP
jgi:prevent-host-death family protein